MELVCWWGVATGVWLLTLSSVNVQDLVLAIVCALPCAAVAGVTRRALGGSWRLRPGWLRWIGPLMVSAVADFGAVLAAAASSLAGRPVTGRLEVVPLDEPGGRTAAGHEALATLVLSATPGSLVADADPEENHLVVHSLGSVGPLQKAVRR